MSYWSKIASLFALSGLLTSSACAVQTEQAVENGETAITAAGSLSFVQSGGFAGIYRQIDVELAMKRIQLRDAPGAVPKEDTLTKKERVAIAKAIAAADLAHTHGPYVCGSCADQFLYDLTFLKGTARYEVHWEDGSSAPPELFHLGTVLRDIAAQHFN